jgi:hypothetical protein
MNASDSRNAKDIKDFLSRATGQASLFSVKKLILNNKKNELQK